MLIDKINFEYVKEFNKKHALNFNFISDFYNDLTNIKVDDFLKDTFFLKKYLKDFKSIEVSCRQYILTSFFNGYINHKFFKSKFFDLKLKFPILSCWKNYFRNTHGMKINYFISFFLLFIKILNSYKKFVVEIFNFLINFKKLTIFDFNQAINLKRENIPYDFKNDIGQYTFIDWLIEKENKDIVVSPKSFDKINYKKKKILFTNQIFFCSSKIKFKAKLLYKFVIIFLESLYFLACGRIIYSLILPELVLYLIAETKSSSEIANKYYFSQSDYIYRPLWTLPLEKKGSEIILYYYAGSFDGYYEKNKYPKSEIGSKIMNWPKVIIWSKQLRNLKEEEARYSKFYDCSLIFFKDSKLNIKIPKNSVSVFDIMPYSYFAKSIEIPNTNFRTFENIFKFFNDILECAKKYEINLVYKSHKDLDNPKSYLGKHTRWSSRYTNYIKKLKNEVILVDYNVSEFKIIENTKFSISYPWTSTAFIAEKLNKKTFFYDPTKQLSPNDRGSQGIYLIRNERELERIFKNIKLEI